MKRIHLSLLIALFLVSPAFCAGIETITYNSLVASISRLQNPVASGRFIVFTASGKSRYTGIAFEHENYKKIYSFQRIIKKDETGKPQKDSDGKPLDTILFYIAEIPPGKSELHYRMVIDGLWTTDPLNEATFYDYTNGMTVSTIPVDYYEIFQTQNVNKEQVHFTYEGKTGSTIRLAGTFNNWDTFMYELTETSPGKFELNLPLPRGIWYYAYFEGSSQLQDNTNQERVYTRDGRVASVVRVE